MVKQHVGAAKKTDVNREWTNCNKMLIKKHTKKQKQSVNTISESENNSVKSNVFLTIFT